MKLLVFGGAHCVPCKKMKGMLDSNGVKYEYVDVEADSTKAQMYGVQGIPMLMTVGADGKPIQSKVGMVDICTVRGMINA